MKLKIGNVLLFFVLGFGVAFVVWWFTPHRVVNECPKLQSQLTVLEQKVYKFEHPEKHTVHFGKAGLRALGAFDPNDNRYLYLLYKPQGTHYRYPLELTCGCNNEKTIRPLYLIVPYEGDNYVSVPKNAPNFTDKIVEVRLLKGNQVEKENNNYEFLRARPDLDSLYALRKTH